ncbi:MAG TPA: substrate-binding domain-containing protein, partial [Ktedonobacterales bacterium]|nr:substrate-binding domain-containing protein [Ktedonobacterales bacterium]
ASTVTTISIPDTLNTIAVYPIAAVKSSTHAATASSFVTDVASSDGQAVLASYGFLSSTAGPLYTPPAG